MTVAGMTDDTIRIRNPSEPQPVLRDQRPEIPGYDMLEKLGESDDAVVWKARQRSLDRTVAVKVLRPAHVTSGDIDRFVTEARTIAQLKGNGLIHIYDVARYEEAYYLIMEFVDGESVSATMRRDRNLPQKRALAIVRDVAETLDSCWSGGKVAHLDLRPDHIMLARDQTVKLANMGMTRIGRGSPATGDPSGQGDAHYMAPEQFTPDAKPDFRTDMYSLGAVLYHMVTGVRPLEGTPRALAAIAHQQERIPNPRDLNPALSIGVAQLVTRLMMKSPEHRYPTWTAAIADIDKVAAGKVPILKHGKAVSTIAAASGTGGPAAAPAMADGGAQPPVTGPARARAPRHAGLRLMLRVLVLAWCVGVGYFLLNLGPLPTLKRSGAVPPEPPAAPPDATATRPRPAPPERPAVVPSPASRPADRTPVPVGHDPSSMPELPVVPPTVPAVDATARTVARHILGEDYRSALAAAERALAGARDASTQASLREIRDAAAYLATLNTTLENAFRAHVGQASELNYAGSRVTIEIKSVDGGKVTADIVTGAGSAKSRRTSTFPISRLDPAERARWLGPATSAKLAAAHYVLAMEAGDFTGAKAAAAKAGPLADALADAAEQRIRLLIP